MPLAPAERMRSTDAKNLERGNPASAWFRFFLIAAQGGVVLLLLAASCDRSPSSPGTGSGGAGGHATASGGSGYVASGGSGGYAGMGGQPATGGMAGHMTASGGSGGATGSHAGAGGVAGAGGAAGAGGQSVCPSHTMVAYYQPGCGVDAVPVCRSGNGGSCAGTYCSCDGIVVGGSCGFSDVPFSRTEIGIGSVLGDKCDPTGGPGGAGGGGAGGRGGGAGGGGTAGGGD